MNQFRCWRRSQAVLIGSNGRVQLAHAETDYRKRLAPEAIVEALRASKAA
ncbi:hypothetical protein PY650_26345 [Rhizobium calliandrae]|uniref:Redoxin domain-containing protein n=1 Tax=Rhizobium calliandrae TaxID=1312182 RepID=A0ABT7KKD1_9HYPH|nr:hypothetical protein [Rhizobium calliandrae]MDL2409092.1 hypothetical protein [Rhizobium calliandrae]